MELKHSQGNPAGQGGGEVGENGRPCFSASTWDETFSSAGCNASTVSRRAALRCHGVELTRMLLYAATSTEASGESTNWDRCLSIAAFASAMVMPAT